MKSESKDYLILSMLPIALAGIVACVALRAPNPPACPQTDLAKLEAEYVAEAVFACKAEGATSAATCKALPAIKAKYDAKRKAWVECK